MVPEAAPERGLAQQSGAAPIGAREAGWWGPCIGEIMQARHLTPDVKGQRHRISDVVEGADPGPMGDQAPMSAG